MISDAEVGLTPKSRGQRRSPIDSNNRVKLQIANWDRWRRRPRCCFRARAISSRIIFYICAHDRLYADDPFVLDAAISLSTVLLVAPERDALAWFRGVCHYPSQLSPMQLTPVVVGRQADKVQLEQRSRSGAQNRPAEREQARWLLREVRQSADQLLSADAAVNGRQNCAWPI